MFSDIAKRYDLLNSLLSMGIHRSWKKRVIDMAGLGGDSRMLDLCAGTADIAILAAGRTTASGLVTALDFCRPMLKLGQEKASQGGVNINCINGDALFLPYKDSSFDAVTVGFGIRNVADIRKAFSEVLRVLVPGGRFICLEFSHPTTLPVSLFYNFYSKYIIPMMGRMMSKDDSAYQYLPDSIREFHNQQELAHIMEECGFIKVGYDNKSGGIVAIHTGTKSKER